MPYTVLFKKDAYVPVCAGYVSGMGARHHQRLSAKAAYLLFRLVKRSVSEIHIRVFYLSYYQNSSPVYVPFP